MSMMIGVQMSDGKMDEDSILNYFNGKGYTHDDDYLFNSNGKFSYFIAAEANYLIFREDDDLDVFTDGVISYLQTISEENGKITVRDEARQHEEDEYLFIGSIRDFLQVWNEM